MVNVSGGTVQALLLTLTERLQAGNFASLVVQRREASAASGWIILSWHIAINNDIILPLRSICNVTFVLS